MQRVGIRLMKTIALGNTGLTVSKACLGTMIFGSQTSPDEARRMVDYALDRGVNVFDTANVYNQGASEEITGRALKKKRSTVVLATKVRGRMKTPKEYGGLSPESIRYAAEESLRRLDTDYIDIYYLHQPDYDVEIGETLEAMDDLRREGKIRFLATSNYAAWQMRSSPRFQSEEDFERRPSRSLCTTVWRAVSSRNICRSPSATGSRMSATIRWPAVF